MLSSLEMKTSGIIFDIKRFALHCTEISGKNRSPAHRRYSSQSKICPSVIWDRRGADKIVHLIRTYFRMDGHHIQFNIVTAETLRKAQKYPEKYRDLIVRVAGYSDYFVDLTPELQDEIINRMEQDLS